MNDPSTILSAMLAAQEELNEEFPPEDIGKALAAQLALADDIENLKNKS